jgi:hypothetical protein
MMTEETPLHEKPWIKGVSLFVDDTIKIAIELLLKKIAALENRLAQIEERGLEYVGTFQRAVSYRRGSVVTADGSMWVALQDTGPNEIPGEHPKWQLAVKAGRDAPRQPTNHSGRPRS